MYEVRTCLDKTKNRTKNQQDGVRISDRSLSNHDGIMPSLSLFPAFDLSFRFGSDVTSEAKRQLFRV